MRIILAFMVMFLLLCYTPSFAQGLYIGGGVGSSFVEANPKDLGGEELKLDKTGFAYKLFAGVKIIKFLGVEGGYRSVGNIKDKSQDVEIESNTKGFDVFAVGRYEFVIAEVFAKAGYFFYDTELKTSLDVPDFKESNNDFAWGLGAGLKFGKIGVRAEWENFNAKDMKNLSMVTAGLTFSLM
jgi:OOP family OmpA-OmpF porin